MAVGGGGTYIGVSDKQKQQRIKAWRWSEVNELKSSIGDQQINSSFSILYTV